LDATIPDWYSADASRCEDARSRCDAAFPERAREIFKVEEIAHRDEFSRALGAGGQRSIGVTLRGSSTYFILRLRSRTALKAAMPDARHRCGVSTSRWCMRLIFNRSSAQGGRNSARQHIEYTIETGGALGAVAQDARMVRS